MPRTAALALALLAALVAAPAALAQAAPTPGLAELRAQIRPYAAAGLANARAAKTDRKRIQRLTQDLGSLACLERTFAKGDHYDALDAIFSAAPPRFSSILSVANDVATARVSAAGARSFAARLAPLTTDDAIVTAGARAWAQIASAQTQIAKARIPTCRAFAAWIRSGFRPSLEPPDPGASVELAFEQDEIAVVIGRAERRLLQLGAAAAAARGFGALPGLGDAAAVELGGGLQSGGGSSIEVATG